MEVDGYGPFPFEIGDVLAIDRAEDERDLAIVLGANYAYVHFWFLSGAPSGIGEPHSLRTLDARIDTVVDEYKKVGSIDPASLHLLHELG